MKNITIQDIAKEANVSKSTVSRVLNGTATVHPDKHKAVMEASKRLGFKPNFVAQSLAKGRSMTIGVLTQNIGSPFYDAIAQGVIAGLDQTTYSPIFVDGQWSKAKEAESIRTLADRRPDGLLLIGGELAAEEILELSDNLHTIVIARRLDDVQPIQFYVDNRQAAFRTTQYLIQQGHREIIFVKGLENHQDAKERLEGYKAALEDAGIAYHPERVLPGDFTAEMAEKSVEKLISQKVPFTAIFAANDITAYGARLALYRRQIEVPGQVSLVGFDNQMESAFVTPPLTSVQQPAREMGEAAAQALLSMIEGVTVDSKEFQGVLQERESVRRVER